MQSDQPLATPTVKAIAVQLSVEAGSQPAEARQELVLSALAAALAALNDSSSPAWTMRAVPGGEPLLYELMPLPGHPVSLRAVWEMTAALRGQPQIAAAEPMFATPQDEPSMLDPSRPANGSEMQNDSNGQPR